MHVPKALVYYTITKTLCSVLILPIKFYLERLGECLILDHELADGFVVLGVRGGVVGRDPLQFSPPGRLLLGEVLEESRVAYL